MTLVSRDSFIIVVTVRTIPLLFSTPETRGLLPCWLSRFPPLLYSRLAFVPTSTAHNYVNPRSCIATSLGSSSHSIGNIRGDVDRRTLIWTGKNRTPHRIPSVTSYVVWLANTPHGTRPVGRVGSAPHPPPPLVVWGALGGKRPLSGPLNGSDPSPRAPCRGSRPTTTPRGPPRAGQRAYLHPLRYSPSPWVSVAVRIRGSDPVNC